MGIWVKTKQKAKDNLPYFLIALLIFLMLFFYLFNSIVITIGSGEAGVLWRRFGNGTVVDKVYGEGIELIFPWDRMQVYNVRVQQVSHEFSVLTRNGLMIDLLISIRYYPELPFLGLLHQKVGPDYLHAIVIPEIEAVLRVLIGRLDAEHVYRTEKAVIEKAINTAIDQLARRYVRVDDVIIKMVSLPETVATAIQEKMTQKHLADAYDFKLQREEKEARRKAIEAGGLKSYNDIVATSLSESVLQWMGIQATLELSRSKNAKVVVIGNGEKGLPIIGTVPLTQTGQETPPDLFDGTAPKAPPALTDAASTGEDRKMVPVPAMESVPELPPNEPAKENKEKEGHDAIQQ